MKNTFLSVVIPCFNEEENLKRGVLNEVRNFLEKQKWSSEVIISDDGSTDESLGFVKKYAQKYPRFRVLAIEHQGKPFVVRAGIEAARGKYVLFTDMDQSTPISEITKLLPFFQNGFDVVIGSRGIVRKGFPWYRKVASWAFRNFRQILLLRNIIDTQCGFKAFKTPIARELFSHLQIFREKERKIKGWRVTVFDVELLFLAQKRGFKIAEVPVRWEDVDVTRGKERNFLKESIEMAKIISQVLINNWRGVYEDKSYQER
jgi:dolichyl-phosphate beta-glucosyltransferase